VNGEKDYLSCHEFNREEVLKWLSYMTTRSGIPVMRFRKYQHTDYPSIQGVWTPFTHQAPEMNVAQFPHVNKIFLVFPFSCTCLLLQFLLWYLLQETLSKPVHLEPTATDKLLEIFKRTQIKESSEKPEN